MFYEINNGLSEITFDQIKADQLAVGIVKSDELLECGPALGFDEEPIKVSQKANPLFRTGADVHENYTFAELRVINRDSHEDSLALFVMKNFILVVDIQDEDGSTTASFLRAIRKIPSNKVCEEKIICYFMDELLSEGNMIAEQLRNDLTEMEESIVHGTVKESFNVELLAIKKKVLKYVNYYDQILDIAETLEENDNEILDEDRLIYITNLTNKVTRLRDDMNAMSNIADHIQDAYATFLDQKLNSTMKRFTIITTIFFPLTIIVGWYGMNFQNMPELAWKYGYLYVILLSAVTILILSWVGRKNKWFK